MKASGKHQVSHRVLGYEIMAFGAIIVFIWLDELLDLPQLLYGAEATPVNWREALLESVVVAIVGVVIVRYTFQIFARMKYLEGFLPVCASCKKIRDHNNTWHPIESYIAARTDANFSHSICPDCAARLYPDFNPYVQKKNEPVP